MKSSEGQTEHLNHYEHLRRLYLFECIYGLITTLIAGVVIYAYTAELNYLLLALGYTLVAGFESYLFFRMKNVTTYHPLVAPRIFHFISMYIIILLLGYFLPDVVCKFIILIPLGISLMTMHPFFLKKYKEASIVIGVITGLALIASEIISKRHEEPLSLENYIFLIYACFLIWLYTFLANGTTKTLKDKMKYFKSRMLQQKEQTEIAHQQMGNMSYKLSLDFRNSLTVIDGQLQEVLDHTDNSVIRDSILSSKQETHKLAESIDSFTTHKKSLIKPLNPEVIDLSKLLSDEITNCSQQLEEKSINISFSPYTGELFPIDKNALRLIFKNLLTNAIDFHHPQETDKWIKVNAYAEANTFYLSVSDNGVGISEEAQDDIFTMFYSTKSESLRGLGLYEVKEALKLLNGEIQLDQSKGHTTFLIQIPFVGLD